MFKQLFSVAAAAALVTFGFGCSAFSNSTPQDNTRAVEEAWPDNDPNGYHPNVTGLGNTNGSGVGGPSQFSTGAHDGSLPGDASGWTLADPTGNRLNMPVIYFAYDSDVLVASERANLDKIASYLAGKNGLGLVIEGHCDQRGTEEYNRALGERRANAIRAYLASKGLSDNRMRTQSFGKDKPAVQGSGESVWGQNRRGVPVPMRMPQY